MEVQYGVGSCEHLDRRDMSVAQSRSLKRRGNAARSLSQSQMEGMVRRMNDPVPRTYTTQEEQNFAWMTEQEFQKKRKSQTQKPARLNFT